MNYLSRYEINAINNSYKDMQLMSPCAVSEYRACLETQFSRVQTRSRSMAFLRTNSSERNSSESKISASLKKIASAKIVISINFYSACSHVLLDGDGLVTHHSVSCG